MEFASNTLLNVHPDQPNLMKFMGISFGIHVAFFVLFLIGGLIGFHKKPPPLKFISVDLVSLPNGANAPAPARSAPSQPAKEKTSVYKKPANIPSPVEAVKPKPEIKQSLKKKTFNPDKTLDDTLEKLKEKVAKEPPDSLTQALDRLNSQVADQENKNIQAADHNDTGTTDQVNSQAGNQAGRMEAIEIYRKNLEVDIWSNWVVPQHTGGKAKDLKAVIIIKIAADGKILDMWFDQRSGNTYYDESARKAILKSMPLPHLPPGFPNYTIGINFTPEALN